MLDDLKLIHTRDSEDALGIASKQADQYQHDFHFSWGSPQREITNVVVAGMGGSGLAAKAFNVWPSVKMPYTVVQDYALPSYVNQKTLLVISSYSGNTEETLSVLNEALARPEAERPLMVVLASGGKLQTIAREKGLPIINLPAGLQPRMTFGYQMRALCEIFESANLTSGSLEDLSKASVWLSGSIAAWGPTNPSKDNKAKQLALDLVGKSVVIYSSTQFFPAAYKWKISLNENAKNIAWCNSLPEFNHNEFLGWSSHPVDKPYAVVDLRSNLDHPEIQKRFLITEQLLSGKRPSPEVVNLVGDNFIQQLVWSIALGDFVSLYTAILNGVNPTPVALVEELKKKLL